MDDCKHNYFDGACLNCGKETPEGYLELNELKSLQRYFLNCGYISDEFHQDIHDLIKKIDKIIKENN